MIELLRTHATRTGKTLTEMQQVYDTAKMEAKRKGIIVGTPLHTSFIINALSAVPDSGTPTVKVKAKAIQPPAEKLQTETELGINAFSKEDVERVEKQLKGKK